MGDWTSSDDPGFEQNRSTFTGKKKAVQPGTESEVGLDAPVTEISMTVPFVTLSSSLRRLTS